MAPPLPTLVKSLLLTAQRRDEVSKMQRSEIHKGDGGAEWIIPAERYKTKVENVVPLSPSVLALLADDTSGFVFSTTNGRAAFSGFSKTKKLLDAKIAELRTKQKREPMPHWTFHDLRRTARTLMSRAGVDADIAERVLGHVIGGVRGTYDRHAYTAEKRDALERLAALVERIINPVPANVTELPARRAKAAR